MLRSYYVMATYKSYSSAEWKRLKEFLRARPLVAVPAVPLLPGDMQRANWAAREVGAPEPNLPGQPDVELPTGRPLPLVWIARLLYGGAAAGLIALVMLAARRKMSPQSRQLIWCLAALGVAFHGIIGLTAIVELPLMRYTVTLWPVVCTSLGIAGLFALDRVGPFKFPRKWSRLPVSNR